MRLVSLLSGTVACLGLLGFVVLAAFIPTIWISDQSALSLSAKRKLFAWYSVCGLSGALISYLGWQYFRMLLGRSFLVRKAIHTGLVTFGLAFAFTAISAVRELLRHQWMDGFLAMVFAALFGGTVIAHYSWLRRMKAGEAIK